MDVVQKDDRVLVVIVNNARDFAIARDAHWYRVPEAHALKRLSRHWPPQWLAFYQTKVFGDEAYAVRYYARVLGTGRVNRQQLFPDEPEGQKTMRWYRKILLGPLRTLPDPILARRWRRIVFIPTTWQKFVNAVEINDLYDESPLEDRLWVQLKRLRYRAERQMRIAVHERYYFLDFGLYCLSGKIDIETDGDRWHSDPARIPLDNRRDNDLQTVGWRILRFNTLQIREGMTKDCVPTIVDTVNRLGGVDNGTVPSRVDRAGGESYLQLGLFDEPDE